MQSYLTKGIICVKDELNIEYRVCIIEHLENEDGSFEYRFFPNYAVIDLLNSDVFQGIPGLNLELKEKVYIRKNILPVFISERVPSINREDYYEILDSVNMKFMEPIEFLIRSKQRYSGDHLYVIKYEERKNKSHENDFFGGRRQQHRHRPAGYRPADGGGHRPGLFRQGADPGQREEAVRRHKGPGPVSGEREGRQELPGLPDHHGAGCPGGPGRGGLRLRHQPGQGIRGRHERPPRTVRLHLPGGGPAALYPGLPAGGLPAAGR